MNTTKKQLLEERGWKVGTVAEFLALSPQEQEYIELKLALARKVKERRQKNHLTQHEVAQLLNSSQSRVAKMEAGDPSVTLDLLIRSLLALGATRGELAQVIGAWNNS